MSSVGDSIWKLLAPLMVMDVVFLIPMPNGMPPQAWHYFTVFMTIIVDVILGPIPAMMISFIMVTICVIGSNYLLFDARKSADPAFNTQRQALKWGLVGFSNITVWLVSDAFVFVLGYEVSGLDRRIAPSLVKFMGKRTLMLGYAIVTIDILLAPFILSNAAHTGGTVFPVVKNLPSLFKSSPNDPSMRRIGGYLMWVMITSAGLSLSVFVTGAASSVLGLEFISKVAGIQISWLQWFLCFLPVGVTLFIVAPWFSYVLYEPEITHNGEAATQTGDELKTMGALARGEWTLIDLALLSLGLQIFSSEVTNVTAAGLLAVSLMLALHAVPWKDITRYNSARSTLINLTTPVVMANGLTRFSFIDWFVNTMSTHLEGFSPNATAIVLALMFCFAHYLFASLSVHAATMLPVILVVGKGIPGVPMEQLRILLVLSIGVVGCLTPYATGPGVIIYGCGYVKSEDYWRLGAILRVIYISMLLSID